jgi:hypothetical protein
MSASGEFNGKRSPAASSVSTKMSMDYVIDAVDSNGDIRSHVVVTGAELIPAVGPGLSSLEENASKELSAMVGLTMFSVMSNTGAIKDYRVQTPPNLSPKLKKSLANIQESMHGFEVRLPQAPVGVGAQWRAEKEMQMNGIRGTTITTRTITALHGSTVEMTIALESHEGAQRLLSEELPKEADVELLEMELKGSGTSTLHLDRIMPVSSLSSTVKTRMQGKSPQPFEMSMLMDAQVSLEDTTP